MLYVQKSQPEVQISAEYMGMSENGVYPQL
jgi:hypothetical protein